MRRLLKPAQGLSCATILALLFFGASANACDYGVGAFSYGGFRSLPVSFGSRQILLQQSFDSPFAFGGYGTSGFAFGGSPFASRSFAVEDFGGFPFASRSFAFERFGGFPFASRSFAIEDFGGFRSLPVGFGSRSFAF